MGFENFLQWLSDHPTFAFSMAVVIGIVVTLFLVAFFQGRELSFWPPKIGERPSKSRKIENLANSEVQAFKTGEDLMRYVNKRLLQAQIQVDDLSWNPPTGLGHGINVSQEIYEEYLTCVEHIAKRIPYREIYIFNRPERAEKLQKRLAKNLSWYYCAFHQDTKIPLLQFMIIDRSEVIILTDQLATRVAVNDSNIVNLFAEYYDNIWKNAVPIKDGPTVNQRNLEMALKSAK